tara:strand:+ start:225725 stop:226615 length:891 start_codon:yes stop_codon:yes gene_type:complete
MVLSCSESPPYHHYDARPPGLTSKVFAPELFVGDSAYVGYNTFDPLNPELYYAITTQVWNSSRIVRRDENGQKDSLDLGINEFWEGEPVFTPDGQKLYFTAVVRDDQLHADLFFVERTDSGWSEPGEFELNTPASEWHISFTEDQTAYFGSEIDGSTLHADLFYSTFENGTYERAIKLPSPVNTEFNDCDPLIAPDESYLIFHSDRPGGFGDHDLYITFRQGVNEWSTPVNMGDQINTGGWEMGPSLSPDGKFLFFTRREAWDTTEPSRIYWVSTGIIDRIKERTLSHQKQRQSGL